MKAFLKLIFPILMLGSILACNFNTTVITPAPVQSTQASSNPTAAPTETQIPMASGLSVSYAGTSLEIPASLATSTNNEIVPRSQEDQGIPYLVNYPAF